MESRCSRIRSLAVSSTCALWLLGTSAGAAAPAPADGRASKECAAPLDATAPAQVKIGDRAAVSTGSKLAFKDKDADGKLNFGVLGPINEDSGANILALRKYLKFFTDEKVDAIIVTGDLPETARGIARSLSELAGSKLPVMVVIGNRECQPEYTKGLALAQKDFSNVINLNQVRAVEFPEATLVSLPGYHDPNFIQCTSGCRYFKSTVDEVIRAAKESKTPVVLVSHGPPHGGGSQSIDYAANTGNVGDQDINRALQEGKIGFGVFSNIKEAGGRATDVAGTTLVAQGAAAKELLLNPGPANTALQIMNDKTKGYGFAAVLSVQGQEASWKLLRNTKPTPDERKQAKALDPKPDEDAAEDAAAGDGKGKGPAMKVTPEKGAGADKGAGKKVAAPPSQPPGSSPNTP